MHLIKLLHEEAGKIANYVKFALPFELAYYATFMLGLVPHFCHLCSFFNDHMIPSKEGFIDLTSVSSNTFIINSCLCNTPSVQKAAAQ